MALTLLAMPDEILLEIMDPLAPKDLCNLARVFTRMTSPAQRVLYQSIFLKLFPPGKPGRGSEQLGNLHVFTRLVNTLLQYPRIREYVSTLSIEVLENPSRTHFTDHERLLSLVPRLKSLSLAPPPANFPPSNLSLPCLERLCLDFVNRASLLGGRIDPIQIIARLFWAPSLRRLDIRGILFTPRMSVLFLPDRHRTASITDLRFYLSDQEQVGCLPDMLLCVKTLECFVLEIFIPWQMYFHSRSAIEPKIVGQSIAIHANTLERLEIAASDAGLFLKTSLIGSLAGYFHVKRLAIPEPFLVVDDDEASTLVDVLPPNLEELQLQFPMVLIQDEDIYRDLRIKRLEQVAAAKHDRFPALRRVIWWYQSTEPGACRKGLEYGSVSDMDPLTATFDKVGVKFEWLSEPFFDFTPFRCDDHENPWPIEV